MLVPFSKHVLAYWSQLMVLAAIGILEACAVLVIDPAFIHIDKPAASDTF
jgi:hypothetical protein